MIMKALKVQSPGKTAVVDSPVPKLRSEDFVLVKTKAVALNPTDWKHVSLIPIPVTVGCDFAGVIEKVGANVTDRFKKGDRVWGTIHGSNLLDLEEGAFAEYLIAKGPVTMKIPDDMSFEDACTSGVGVITVGQGLYQHMPLAWPNAPLNEKIPILIYGGSSAMGAIGIQFAKLSGYQVITTCSPRNFDYVKSLGADVVFDYSSPTCGADIRTYTNNKLYYAWDTIGGLNGPQICADALASIAPEGQELYYGMIAAVEKIPRDDITKSFSLAYTAQGEKLDMTIDGVHYGTNLEDYEFAKKWLMLCENLLFEGKWKPHRAEVREGGLEGIPGGLEDLKNGKVSGVKLVYRINETDA